MSKTITLLHLLNYALDYHPNEKSKIQEFFSRLDNGTFYLGGQIKMTLNEYIGLDTINEVRKINIQREKEYGPPCNSFERISVNNSIKELELIEKLLLSYYEFILSETLSRDKTSNNDDLNNYI